MCVSLLFKIGITKSSAGLLSIDITEVVRSTYYGLACRSTYLSLHLTFIIHQHFGSYEVVNKCVHA